MTRTARRILVHGTLSTLFMLLLCINGQARKFRASQSAPEPAQITIGFAKGVFIVADPKLTDPNFNGTVVLMLHHDSEGSMGLIINRPTDTPLSKLIPEVKSDLIPDDPLYTGGPVLPGTLTVLFRSNAAPDGLTPVFENIYASQEARVFAERLSATHRDDVFRLYSGYAGWGPGQLENEIARGDWRVVKADAASIFEAPSDRIWQEMINRSQERVVMKTGESEDPNPAMAGLGGQSAI